MEVVMSRAVMMASTIATIVQYQGEKEGTLLILLRIVHVTFRLGHGEFQDVVNRVSIFSTCSRAKVLCHAMASGILPCLMRAMVFARTGFHSSICVLISSMVVLSPRKPFPGNGELLVDYLFGIVDTP